MSKALLGIGFLIAFAGNGAFMFVDPVGWARLMGRINPYMPVLRYAETRGGLLQLRITGAVFSLVAGVILVAAIKAWVSTS